MAHRAAPLDIPVRPTAPYLTRLIKRFILIVAGPIYFLCIAFVPLLCVRRKGFRGWYWRTVKRACSRLLWLLNIRAEISQADRDSLSADINSIIVINHRSHLDGFALMDVVPDDNWFTFAAKKELCDAPLLRTGFRGAGLVEVDRRSGSIAMGTLGKSVADMPARRSIVLFPEGTRTQGPGLGPFKAGAVLLARQTGRRIRPIVLHGSAELLPKGRFWPSSGTIRVAVLPPFDCDPRGDVDDDVARLRAVMMADFDAG